MWHLLGLVLGGFLWAASFLLAAPTAPATSSDPMAGVPSKAELKRRRDLEKKPSAAFLINPTSQRLEARDKNGQILEEFAPGTVSRALEVEGHTLRISFGRDEKQRLCLLVRPGPAQDQPVQISVFDRRLILPPGTSVTAAMEKNGRFVTIEPCLTGTIYYLDTEPTAVDASPDNVRLVASKNLVRIGREVQQGRVPDEELVDAVVQGRLKTEEKQTPSNNTGLAVGAWFQNATTSLMGLPNPQASTPATVVKVSAGTPELSAPAGASLTPNADVRPVVQDRNSAGAKVNQEVKIIALRSDPGEGIAPQKPFVYEEGSQRDLEKASQKGLRARPLEDARLAAPPPGEALSQKPPGDGAGNTLWKAFRSFLGMPEAATVQAEAEKLAAPNPK